jgi:DNA topoisomerase-3
MAPQTTVVLNVAEKNSVAKEVARLLARDSRPQEIPSNARYCKNFKFPFTLNGSRVDMIFSSVAGHLMELDFTPQYKPWHGCRPGQLFTAPVVKQVSKDGESIKANLQSLARRAHWLVLWLDCDREGENIAFEVLKVCKDVNPRLIIKRARFSALIPSDIFRAINNLVEPNANEAAAVDVRQEIDLRIGSSFTRLQTLLLGDKFDWREYLQEGRNSMLLSYGPCQFPTLGLIVQREWEIQAHIPEAFWTMYLTWLGPSAAGQQQRCEFSWCRGRLFDQGAAELYHAMCTGPEQPVATVTNVTGRQRTRAAPVPLCTLELQKKASQALRVSGERIMKVAEELYQGGFISYPRTETNLFSQGYDLQGMVQKQAESGSPWSQFAHRLLSQGEFRWPKSGGKDDGAHPPIHPTRPLTDGADGLKRKIYEFIARSFLACCAPDAVGQETEVLVDLEGESFKASGLMVTHRNWLDVYPYTNWGGGNTLPNFVQGQTLVPNEVRLHRGTTAPPPRMSESDLLAKMDAYGIGTDATVADHIAKQLHRGYATKDESSQTFAPTPLGQALISAYNKMELNNLWVPTLRGVIECNINAVAHGQRSASDVLKEALEAFSADYRVAESKAPLLEREVRDIVFAHSPSHTNGGGADSVHGGWRGEGELIGPCPLCSHNLVLVHPSQVGQARSGSCPFITCTAPTTIHGESRPLPARATKSATVTSEFCSSCSSVRKIKFSFDRALIPPNYHHMAECTICITCDVNFSRMLAMLVGESNGHQMHHTAGYANGTGNGLARVPPLPPPPPPRDSAQQRQERGRGRGRGGVRARARGRGR